MTASGPPEPDHTSDPRSWLERHLPVVDEVLDWICRRHGLGGDEADGLRSYANLRLVQDDYRTIRAYSGRAGPRTYLAVVLTNVFRDYRIERWGKWRPSAAARRVGTPGVLLDTFMNRDGQSRDEAVRRTASRDDVDLSEAELTAIATRLPRRTPRSFRRLQDVGPIASEVGAHDSLRERERLDGLETARTELERALEELPDQDRLILRLHHWEGLTIAAVARMLGLEQRPLYRKMDRLYARLRTHLEDRGIRSDDVLEWMP